MECEKCGVSYGFCFEELIVFRENKNKIEIYIINLIKWELEIGIIVKLRVIILFLLLFIYNIFLYLNIIFIGVMLIILCIFVEF